MKDEKLFEVLGNMDPETVKKAHQYNKKNSGWKKIVAAVACFAVIIGLFGGVSTLKKGKDSLGGDTYSANVKTVLAAYPAGYGQGMSKEEFAESESNMEWNDDFWPKREKSIAIQDSLAKYNQDIMKQLLTSSDENVVCSPLNTYIAMAMLAEVTEGTTRDQILQLLDVKDMETLRKNVGILWDANYVNTPILNSTLANSLWLNENVEYDENTLNRLASDYFASSFVGDPSTNDMTQALRKWTNDNTGGLMKDSVKNMQLDADTVLNIVSTIYFKGSWTDEFDKANTQAGEFHGTQGDMTVDMMHKTDEHAMLYRTDDFTCADINIDDGGAIYFFLPNDGVKLDSLLSNEDALKAVRYDSEDTNRSYVEINYTIPKFKITSDNDLGKAMKKLGATDVFDPDKANFKPLTAAVDDIVLSSAKHTAMVEIDEDGIVGTAFTSFMCGATSAGPEETYDFVVDRPFIFMVTGMDGSILFAGAVRNL